MTNFTTYIFGDFGSGYTQLPDDASSKVFSHIAGQASCTTQIAVHRTATLIYYCYLRRMGGHYIGIAVAANSIAVADIAALFPVFEKIVETMVVGGYLLHFDDNGNIVPAGGMLYANREQADIVAATVASAFSTIATVPLPPMNYATAGGSTQRFPADADKDQIAKACHSGGYVFIDKDKGYDTLATNGFRGQLRKKQEEIKNLKFLAIEQLKEIDGLKNKQRNTTVVAVLAAIVIVLGMVVWNKVLFPSEVTKKDMGEYIYYGPMADGKPNGTGVAIYKNDDSDGRLYYYGNFTNGERQDEAAVLFYRNGTYFRGKMKGDKWQEGLLLNVDKEMFLGTFENNQPYVGDWYKYEHAQHVDKWE